jgi:hypothetical protein
MDIKPNKIPAIFIVDNCSLNITKPTIAATIPVATEYILAEIANWDLYRIDISQQILARTYTRVAEIKVIDDFVRLCCFATISAIISPKITPNKNSNHINVLLDVLQLIPVIHVIFCFLLRIRLIPYKMFYNTLNTNHFLNGCNYLAWVCMAF